MNAKPTNEQIIVKMSHFYRDELSARAFEILSTIADLEPGIDAVAIRIVIANIETLLNGEMLVLSGKIGCGKTIAATAGALLYQYREQYERRGRTESIKWENPGYCKWVDYEKIPGEDLPPQPEGVESKYPPRFKITSSRAIIKAPFSPYPNEFNDYCGCLVIDDLGREHFTDKGFGIAEWDYLIDRRYSEKLPAIITTNLAPDEFVEKYNNRILDRLKECAAWEEIAEKTLRKKREANK